MQIFYSKSTGGFYREDLHDVIPDDSVKITEELWLAMLEGQQKGKEIVPGPDGGPMLAEPAPVIQHPMHAAGAALSQSDRVVMRCYEAGVPVPQSWREYRAALRKFLSGESEQLPTKPEFPENT